MPQPAWHQDSLASRLPFLRRRARLARAVRAFFEQRGYTEVETPYAVPAPGADSSETRSATGGPNSIKPPLSMGCRARS